MLNILKKNNNIRNTTKGGESNFHEIQFPTKYLNARHGLKWWFNRLKAGQENMYRKRKIQVKKRKDGSRMQLGEGKQWPKIV
jgi:hypothetical protein